jgi:hypothetical protein
VRLQPHELPSIFYPPPPYSALQITLDIPSASPVSALGWESCSIVPSALKVNPVPHTELPQAPLYPSRLHLPQTPPR